MFGPSLRSRDLAEVANLPSPGAPPDMAWRDFARSQPGMGSSPRQRPNFARDVASTPAFLLPSSPLARDSGFPSPSLPFVAPGALVASKRNLAARRTQKKIIPRRRLVDSQASWLLLYFAFNLGLTLYNKGVLVRFPYPYTLTAVHALFGTVGGYLLRHRNAYTPAHLSLKSYAVLAAYSVLFAVNIAVSNLSLQLVTIPVSILCHPLCLLIECSQFHQVVRAATPIFTTLISTSLFGTRFTSAKLVTLVPVMLGVILAYVLSGSFFLTSC